MHHDITYTSSAINIQNIYLCAGIFNHRIKNITHFIRNAFKRRPAQMRLFNATRKADNRSARIHIPVRRTKAHKCRNKIRSIRVRHAFCKPVNLRRGRNKLKLVTKPLNHRSTDKNASFKRILNLTANTERNCRQKLLRHDRLGTCVHQHEASSSVSIFRIAFVKASLPKKRGLLVANRGCNRYRKAAYIRVGVAVDFA